MPMHAEDWNWHMGNAKEEVPPIAADCAVSPQRALLVSVSHTLPAAWTLGLNESSSGCFHHAPCVGRGTDQPPLTRAGKRW
jgi:hypothetical protein